MEEIDFSKVLWSSERQTDKIFNLQRFTLTIPAGQTSSPGFYPIPYLVDGRGPKLPVDNIGEIISNRWMAYFKSGNAWLPASPINGSAAIAGVSVGFGLSGFVAFSLSSTGSDRSVDCVAMYMPTTAFSYTSGLNTYTSTTDWVVPYNTSPRAKVKWSSFDRQATVAGSSAVVYVSDGTARRLATIPHGMAKRPTVMFSVNGLGAAVGMLWATSPTSDFITIWKDTTNIYIEYTPPSTGTGGNHVVQVWWYNE